MNNKLFEEYNKAKEKVEDADKILDSAKAEFDAIKQAIIDNMEQEGIQNITIDDYKFSLVKVEHWPKIEDKLKMVDWFLNEELKDYLTVNSKTLGSFIKETQEIPDGVVTTPKTDLRRGKC